MNQIASNLSLAGGKDLKPEWLRIPAAMRVSGLSRNVVFRHIKDGTLKSKVYQVPGNKKISRFVNYDSLLELMDGLPDGQHVRYYPKAGEAAYE
jgi:predicted DNA-binding transcriptional regulator AlpA